MAERIDKYGPLLDTYLTVSERLPAILGWDGPRRYLVLTQNPAELRPTGGFIGSYGIIAFDKGRITERSFRDIYLLDLPWDYPFIKPPTELANYLLGPKQPWQLADANWSPDFPTSAQDAIRLYTNESGDTRIDGVLGITTYTIDELLKVTGPITVPEYGATIASGETTLKTLQLTRTAPGPGGEPQGLPVGLRGPALRAAARPAARAVGPTPRPGRHVPEPAPPAGLVPRPGRPGPRRGERLRRRRPRGPRRLRLPGGLQRGAHLQAQRGDHPLAGPRRSRSTRSATPGTPWT